MFPISSSCTEAENETLYIHNYINFCLFFQPTVHVLQPPEKKEMPINQVVILYSTAFQFDNLLQ